MQKTSYFLGNRQSRPEETNNDRYDVYVNNDFIGQKRLYNQHEEIYDLEDFLQEQGFSELDSELQGNYFYINGDERNSEQLRETLNIYLQSR